MKERTNIVRKRVIKAILLLDLFFWGLILVAFGPWELNRPILKDGNYLLLIIVMVVGTIVMDLLLKIPFSIIYKDEEQRKESKKIVNEALSIEKHIEVIPIKASAYECFIVKLTDIAKFYAIMDEEDDKIIISAKFNCDGKRRFFERVYKEDFAAFYKIK